MSDTESCEANNEEEVGYVVVSNRRHPPSIVFQSTVRASLRREALGVYAHAYRQATQEVARLQRITARLAVQMDTLRVELEGPLMDLDPEYNGLAGLLNGLEMYHNLLCQQVQFYLDQSQQIAFILHEHFPSLPWQGYI